MFIIKFSYFKYYKNAILKEINQGKKMEILIVIAAVWAWSQYAN